MESHYRSIISLANILAFESLIDGSFSDFNVCEDLQMLASLLRSCFQSSDVLANFPSDGSSDFVKVIIFSRGCVDFGVELQDL